MGGIIIHLYFFTQGYLYEGQDNPRTFQFSVSNYDYWCYPIHTVSTANVYKFFSYSIPLDK